MDSQLHSTDSKFALSLPILQAAMVVKVSLTVQKVTEGLGPWNIWYFSCWDGIQGCPKLRGSFAFFCCTCSKKKGI